MRCPKCQTDNLDTRKFCRECGADLARTCPGCGTENLPGDKFCGECGRSLTERKAPPTIDYSEPLSYTPKFLADKILTTRSAIEGERKLVTVLFADVADYTSMASRLDPEEVHQIMDGCFRMLMDEIHKYEGTIDKFTGDGVMALFGAPVAREDHVQLACYAALSIRRALEEYGAKLKKDCGLDFKMRLGLNSGRVIVGSIGNDLRMDYTAIGDTTNLASRMQEAARPGTILVSRDIYRIAKGFFEFKPVGKLKVKGKAEPVDAYELTEVGRVETRFEAAIARGLTKFVGREREIALLEEAFARAKAGSGQVVGVVGEAGVGKSRLILEMRGALPKDEYTYLEGRCLHYGRATAYLPVLDILRSYFDFKEGEREFAVKKKIEAKLGKTGGKLEGVLPPLYDILSLRVEDEEYLRLQPHQKREKTFEAIRDLLVRASQDRPLVIAFEDSHWVDKTSEEFLTYFIGWLANTRITLIILYRPEYTHPWGSKSFYSQIGVDQLSTKSSAELVQSILEGGEVEPAIRELVLSRAGGNPLFVEEFTYSLVENGSIERKDHKYVLSRNVSDIQVPDSIQGIITARIDRLEDNLKRTMQVASVIGRDFAFRILQTITGMQGELKSYLLNLQGLEFIYEKSLFPELEYIFKHALTQEVAYNSLLLKRRRKIHEKIGTAIEKLYPDRLEELYEMLAHHYSKAETPEKAHQYLRLSGDKASRSYSNWEAFRFYKEAIEALNKLPDTEENRRKGVELRLKMEGPMRILAYPEDSIQVLLDGEKLARELGDQRALTAFYSSIGLCYAFKGDPLRRREYTENCFREAERLEDIEMLAPTGFDLCSSYTIAGEHLKILDVAPGILALLERTGREAEFFSGPFNFNLYSALSIYCGYAMGNLGDFERGEALCEKGLRFAMELDNPYSLAFAEMLYGSLFIVKGDGKQAVEHLQRAVQHGEEGQIIPLLGLAWMRLGWGHYFLGDRETALKHIEKALKIQGDAGLALSTSQFYYCLGAIHLDSGDLKKARRCAQEALKLAQANSERHLEATSRVLLGRALGKAGPSQTGKAEASMLQGINTLNKMKLRPASSQGYLYLGEHHAELGRSDRALEYLGKAQAMFEGMGMDYWRSRAQAAIEKL